MMISLQKFYKEIPATCLLVVALAFALGWFARLSVADVVSSPAAAGMRVKANSPEFPFINPTLYTDNSTVDFPDLALLKNGVDSLIDKEIDGGDITRASFYFRYMDSGEWTGVRPNDEFYPASLLKIIDLIVYLHMSESDPNVMYRKLYYDAKNNTGQNYPPEHYLANGAYQANELITQTIVESDNAAHIALKEPIEKELEEFYHLFHLPLGPSGPSVSQDFISARDVSILFRSLYGATYLNDTDSNQALALLTKTKFSKGIMQNIPPNVAVANKFGEYTVYFVDSTKKPEHELHDCGIVYYPGRPYFICVMTEGDDFASLEKIIGDISEKTFKFVSTSS